MSEPKYIYITRKCYKSSALDGCRQPLIRNKYHYIVVECYNGYFLARLPGKKDCEDVKRMAMPLPENSQIVEYC